MTNNQQHNQDQEKARIHLMGNVHALRMITHCLLITHPQGSIVHKLIAGIADQQVIDPDLSGLDSQFWAGFQQDISTALDVIESGNSTFDHG